MQPLEHRWICRLSIMALLCMTAIEAAAIDPIRDLTGRTLKGHVERRIERIGNSAGKFLHNPIDYTLGLPEKIVADACAAPIRSYEGTLHGQVRQWHQLPPGFIQAAQPFYSINLAAVRFAVDIRTSNGAAQAFGNVIYFPTPINFGNQVDVHWMLHELEHVVQYANSSWGVNGKLCEYTFKAFGAGFDSDHNSLEQSAIRKADAVIGRVWNQLIASSGTQVYQNQIWIRNANPQPVSFYLRTATFGEYIQMQPFEQRTFQGAPLDNWFYIEVPNGLYGPVTYYTLRGATRQHIVRRPDGVLDVFWSY